MIRKALFTTGTVLLLFSPTVAMAQNRPSIFLGGGVTIPISDYADLAKTGWMATGGVTIPVGTRGIFIPIEGLYGRNDHDVGGSHSNLYGGTAGIGYRFGEASRVGVYLFGAGGVLVHRFVPGGTASSTSNTEFAYTGGAGVDIPVSGKVSLWIESRYFGRDEVKFVPVFGGISIGL